MFGTKTLQNLAPRLTLASLEFIRTLLDSASYGKHLFKSLSVLNDQFRFAIDGKNFGAPGQFEAAQMGARVALEICQGADVSHVDHNIQFTVLSMFPWITPTRKPLIA